jgi:fused signal recognition particle receptor
MEVIALLVVIVVAIGIGFFVTRKPQLPAKDADPKLTTGSGESESRNATTEPPKRDREQKDLAALKQGLQASRKGFMGRLFELVSGKTELDPTVYAQLEETLLASDVGPAVTALLLERLKTRLAKKDGADAAIRALKAEALAVLQSEKSSTRIALTHKPTVVLIVGVNGVGKTTTIGKLATRFCDDGKKVMLGAADTFRAAAVQQLEVWGNRVGATVVRGKEGADPGSVAFEAATQAKAQSVDVLLVDTAGRLHNKAPLMDEIRKVKKTLGKAYEGAPHEVLLVLDATTGQNALSQAALFKEAVDLTGIVLTKLDGTAKGGIVLAIAEALKVPVRYIGLGERAEDLRDFDAEDFIEALFAEETEG